MEYRIANIEDIPQIREVRAAVRENRLSNPDLVTAADCEEYLLRRGRGWVCVADDRVVGFSIVDLVDHNVWALFVLPDYEGMGIGKRLHDDMLDWYFAQTDHALWLGTAPGTRAEQFYRRKGWQETGRRANGEIHFERSHR